MTDDEKFSRTWKNVMQRITTAYIFNKTANSHKLNTDYLMKDETLNVLSIMTFKGLIKSFDVQFGLVPTKSGKQMVGIIGLTVYGINPRANNDKYIKSFEFANRMMMIYGNGGIAPVAEIVGKDPADKFDKQTYEEHVRDEIVRTNIEYLDSEDSSTKELNKNIMAELAK